MHGVQLQGVAQREQGLKAPLEIIEAGKTFFAVIPSRRLPDGGRSSEYMETDTLLRIVKERHRDGRIRTVLRGRGMRAFNQFKNRKYQANGR